MRLNSLSKRVVTMLLAIIITLLGVTGCMSKKPNPEEIKNKMITYLQEKYGEEFVPISLSLRDHAYSSDRLYAYPKKGTKKDLFEVSGQQEDGSYVMHDGYFGIYIKPEYEKVLSGFVGEIYKDFKLYTNFSEGVLPDRLNKNTQVEEIYSKDEYFFSDTAIFVKESSAKGIDGEESLRKIAEKMKDKKMVGSVDIYVVFDNKFGAADLNALNLTPSEEKAFFLEKRKSIKVTDELQVKKYGEGENSSNG